MKTTGLVLEGGGMRGLYTAGVLEFFLEQKLLFPYVIGVSAGACMGASYLSRQKGRNKEVNVGLAGDHRFISFRNLLFKRQLFGMDFLFDEIPNKIVPFDHQTFRTGSEQFVIGTTDCETGKPIYYNKHNNGEDILTIIRASSSLPFVAPAVSYGGKTLLDGGIIDPIPIRKAQSDGFKKNVVIMTKAEDFRRQPTKAAMFAKFIYRKHPKIAELLEKRHLVYNDTLALLEEQENAGEVFVIKPSIEVPVSRIERNQARLLALYELGYEDAKKQYSKLLSWLS
ncbi:patatin-like phospholipase family protein [Alkalihalobacterium chitinilyticum]|uniref:Patatin family protein n=1 Tax=Alkalihalobacterium chitinilyticum TaxID=2980103 RepID=A0ABT5VJR6_9BACI|nr:patatin family protein [Alkalihalobacterium chitinilyticum]MDE5415515.1 patatin family protein [Alkalihalobacterium chitinilyticum]